MRLRACTALLALSACTYSSTPPNLQGQDVHLTVLHTADVHSRVLPYNFTPNKFDQLDGLTPDLAPFGGAARMSSLLQRERAKSSRVIHVDSGDCFQGAPIFNAFNGAVEMRAMSALGLDVAALGNHEFDKGPINLSAQIQQWAGFPILAANYAFKDPTVIGDNILGALIKPYTILDADGLKVGVIGMGNVSAISQLVQGENSLGVIPLDTDQTIEYYASLLRPQVDILVAPFRTWASMTTRPRRRRTRANRRRPPRRFAETSMSSSAATCTSCSTRPKQIPDLRQQPADEPPDRARSLGRVREDLRPPRSRRTREHAR